MSCANYFWETIAWLCFSLLTQCATSYLFLAVSFMQMNDWAQKKHRRYITDFRNYPKDRRAILPYLF